MLQDQTGGLALACLGGETIVQWGFKCTHKCIHNPSTSTYLVKGACTKLATRMRQLASADQKITGQEMHSLVKVADQAALVTAKEEANKLTASADVLKNKITQMRTDVAAKLEAGDTAALKVLFADSASDDNVLQRVFDETSVTTDMLIAKGSELKNMTAPTVSGVEKSTPPGGTGTTTSSAHLLAPFTIAGVLSLLIMA